MKTSIQKLVGLCFGLLASTIVIAQEPGGEAKSMPSATESIQVTDDTYRPVNPGASAILEFKVFPNPANCTLYVRMGVEPNVQSELRIFNPLWQEVYYRDVTGANDLTIDVTNFAEGAYYVRLTTGKNDIQVKKIYIMP